ncbi:MAG: tRNA wybutosine-synthesizing 3 family protein [Candidatus Pacearchaeota archaeon]
MEAQQKYKKEQKQKTLLQFLNEKKQALSKTDKSKKATIDKAIMPLVNLINKSKFFYTTSSCSGRVILMKESGKKQPNAILFSSHEKLNEKIIIEQLKKIESENKNAIPIYFKYEPPILHVITFDSDYAAKLVETARQSGFKKSGFYYGKRQFPIIEIRGSEEIILPIFLKVSLIDKKYIKILVKETNKKIWQSRQKLERLMKNLKLLLNQEAKIRN